mgnify:CR=1 FL=1
MNVLLLDLNNDKIKLLQNFIKTVDLFKIIYINDKKNIDYKIIYDYVIINSEDINEIKEIVNNIQKVNNFCVVDLIYSDDEIVDKVSYIVDNLIKKQKDDFLFIKYLLYKITKFYNKFNFLINQNINLNLLYDKFSFIETDEEFNILYITSNLLNKLNIKNNHLKELLTAEQIEKIIKNNEIITQKINDIEYTIEYIKLNKKYYFIFKENIIKNCINELIENHKNNITTEIFAKLSHELRTPIMAISIFFDYLKDSIKDEGLKEKIDLCLEEIKIVSKILNYSIDFIKVNNSVKLIDIKEIIEKVIYLYKNLYHTIKFNYYVNVEQKIILQGNPIHFRNVIINIIKNAVEQIIQNNIEDGTINIYIIIEELKIINEEKIKILKIKIIDNGGGLKINKEDIFNLFKLNNKKNGNNIGLVYCKQIIESMGGKIIIDNYYKGVKVELQFIV